MLANWKPKRLETLAMGTLPNDVLPREIWQEIHAFKHRLEFAPVLQELRLATYYINLAICRIQTHDLGSFFHYKVARYQLRSKYQKEEPRCKTFWLPMNAYVIQRAPLNSPYYMSAAARRKVERVSNLGAYYPYIYHQHHVPYYSKICDEFPTTSFFVKLPRRVWKKSDYNRFKLMDKYEPHSILPNEEKEAAYGMELAKESARRKAIRDEGRLRPRKYQKR